jgi:ferredoxin
MGVFSRLIPRRIPQPSMYGVNSAVILRRTPCKHNHHIIHVAVASNSTSTKPASKLHVTFVSSDGKESETVECEEGQHLLEIAHANDVDLEGACEASLACSTCHVIVERPEDFDRIPEPSDEENDMLDLAFGLTEFSRLGCQVKMTPALDGLRVRIPAATRNMAVDGFKPKPH